MESMGSEGWSIRKLHFSFLIPDVIIAITKVPLPTTNCEGGQPLYSYFTTIDPEKNNNNDK